MNVIRPEGVFIAFSPIIFYSTDISMWAKRNTLLPCLILFLIALYVAGHFDRTNIFQEPLVKGAQTDATALSISSPTPTQAPDQPTSLKSRLISTPTPTPVPAVQPSGNSSSQQQNNSEENNNNSNSQSTNQTPSQEQNVENTTENQNTSNTVELVPTQTSTPTPIPIPTSSPTLEPTDSTVIVSQNGIAQCNSPDVSQCQENRDSNNQNTGGNVGVSSGSTVTVTIREVTEDTND